MVQEAIRNRAVIEGTAASPYEEAYSTSDGPCLRVLVSVRRHSGTPDTVPVIVPESCLADKDDPTGCRIKATGAYMSKNRHAGGEHHLELAVYADTFVLQGGDGRHMLDENSISLTGYVTKAPSCRTLHNGRRLADLMIAVNAPDPRNPSYIPCIAWGQNAVLASGLEAGDLIHIEGRAQSREYLKKLPIGEDGGSVTEQRTAYEVSCMTMAVLERRGEREARNMAMHGELRAATA